MRFEDAPIGSITAEVEKVGGDDKTPPSTRIWTRERLPGGRDKNGFVPSRRLSVVQRAHDGRIEFEGRLVQDSRTHWATPVQIVGDPA